MRINCSSQRAAVFVGFDSAWAGNKKAPGAICSIAFDGAEFSAFQAPSLVGFEQASTFIEAAELPDRPLLVAIDQPTVVPNETGMRPVEKVAASLVGWLGGGVQPAYRNKAMFGADAPIWAFLNRLGAVEAPEAARDAIAGRHVIEVFPALALPSLDGRFFGPLLGPRYNPGNKKRFKVDDWWAVVEAASNEARRLDAGEVAEWLDGFRFVNSPRKRDQDMLDAAICLLVAIRWRLAPRDASTMLGDVESGYIVAPVSPSVRAYLEKVARDRELPMDDTALVAE